MNNYTPLTKIIIDDNGDERAVCAFHDIENCQNYGKCDSDCVMHTAVLQQLNIFEQIFLECEDENDTNGD